MESMQLWARDGEAVRQAIALGAIAHIETAREEFTDEFLLFAIERGLLQTWAHTFPDPRGEPELGLEVLLPAHLAARFAGLYSRRQAGYVLRSARVLALHVVEYVLAERAQRPRAWPPCPSCGVPLRSQGFAQRQLMCLFGPIHWRRRVGRCPQGCAIPQVAPVDEALGGQPHQRTSGELQWLGCAFAVFVPFATAARLLGWYGGGLVSPRAVWCWVQAAGHHAMALLQEDLEAVARGDAPPPEVLAAALVVLPLALGADGVMVPFRPTGGAPTGKIRWREIKVGVLARLGQHRTRLGQVVTRLQHRRLVAVLGDIEALSPRLWGEAVRQGILQAPHVVWRSDGDRGWWRLFEERFAGHARGILDFYPPFRTSHM